VPAAGNWAAPALACLLSAILFLPTAVMSAWKALRGKEVVSSLESQRLDWLRITRLIH